MSVRPAPLAALALLTAAAPEPQAFRPDLFFAGRTHGSGTVTVATSSRPRILSVEGAGRIAPDGEMILDQAVTLDGKTTPRTFRIRRTSGNIWQGTLTGAAGPVRGAVADHRMTLTYAMPRGMRMNQILTLQPGGRAVRNSARVTLMGIQVASIEETIEKLD